MRNIFLYLFLLIATPAFAVTDFVVQVGSGQDYTDPVAAYSALNDASDIRDSNTAVKVFDGTRTGTISDGATVTLYRSGVSQSVTATVTHATATQIFVRAISNTSFSFQASDEWRVDGSNLFTNSSTGDSARLVIQGNGTMSFTGSIDGLTTDIDNSYIIECNPSDVHPATDASGCLFTNTTDFTNLLTIADDYGTFRNARLKKTNASGNNYAIIVSAANITIDSVIIFDSVSTNNTIHAIFCTSGCDNLYVINSECNDNDGACIRSDQFNANIDIYAFNNTSVQNGTGFQEAGNSTWTLKNNIAYGNTTDYSGTFDTHSNNLSGDNSSPDSTFRSKTPVFVNSAGDDFRLDETDTEAKDKGASDPGSGFFSDDVLGTARPQGAAWDIGFFEIEGEDDFRSAIIIF